MGVWDGGEERGRQLLVVVVDDLVWEDVGVCGFGALSCCLADVAPSLLVRAMLCLAY